MFMRNLRLKIRNRIIDVVLSVYLFNEQRGFSYLEKLARIFGEKYPDQVMMLQSIQKHARDDRQHYQLFCGYFKKRGYMPSMNGVVIATKLSSLTSA